MGRKLKAIWFLFVHWLLNRFWVYRNLQYNLELADETIERLHRMNDAAADELTIVLRREEALQARLDLDDESAQHRLQKNDQVLTQLSDGNRLMTAELKRRRALAVEAGVDPSEFEDWTSKAEDFIAQGRRRNQEALEEAMTPKLH